ILSEIGIDMSRFPTDAHLVLWACICPRSDESAGKRRSNRIRKGSRWLKATLVQCAWAAVKGTTAISAPSTIASGCGAEQKKATVAVAAPMLTAIYHMLKNGTLYEDLGYNHFDRHGKERQKNRLIKRLTDLGYAVQVASAPAYRPVRLRGVSL